MARKMQQIAILLLSALLLSFAALAVEPEQQETSLPDQAVEQQGASALPDDGAADPYRNLKMRIGIVYGSGALYAAHLLNASTSPVTGYRFGYFDGSLDFVELGRTEQTALSILRTINIYRIGETYYDSNPGAGSEVLGCYHLQMPGTFESYAEASQAAAELEGGFVAWIDGVFCVRQGSYTTSAAAAAAAQAAVAREAEPAADVPEADADDEADGETQTIDEPSWDTEDEEALDAEPWPVVYTSVYSVNVVKTGTTEILLQFDGLADKALGIMPGQTKDGEEQAVTWFKGYKYYGGFRYERIGGGNITVVNIVPLDTYVKGVVPYESYKQWPLETLKAQAMCAKNYGLTNRNKHNGSNFDLCTTTDCQVYHGAGSGNVSPSELSDRAVDEISGYYAWYGNKLIQTYFYSSNGGGSEDVSNVWGSNQAAYPYLTGVVDPYEADVADKIPNYRFSKTFTNAQLTSILRERGYAGGTTVTALEPTYSRTGNVLTLKFTYANGKSNTFNCPKTNWLKNALGCRSIHFTVTPTGGTAAASGPYAVNGTEEAIRSFSGLYAITGTGEVTELAGSEPYVVTDSGTVAQLGKASTSTGATGYLISGAGWGHNIGYSQWGGYAMALRGFNYAQILEFYYPGAHIGPRAE